MFGTKGCHVSDSGAIQGHHGPLIIFFSSPEHKMLRVGYCDGAVSVVRRPSSTFWLVYALEATFLSRLS